MKFCKSFMTFSAANVRQVLKLPNFIKIRLEHDIFQMLEIVRGSPWATGLQYAFREGKWLFLVTGADSFFFR